MQSSLALRSFGLLGLVLSMAGCAILEADPYQLESSTVGTPLERLFSVSDASPLRGVAVDAKQRFVWSPHIPVRTVLIDDQGNALPKMELRSIICAEPSPDTLSAIASTIDTELRKKTALTSGDSVEAVGRLAGTLSETAQTIGPRTQVIQLLRDGFYRACEAYANGALDDFGYSMILSQIDLFMLQLLSADALGRAQGAEDMAERTAQRDQAVIRVQNVRGELLRAGQTLKQFNEQTQNVANHAARLTALNVHKSELEQSRQYHETRRNTLEGSAETPGSIPNTRVALAAIAVASETANVERVKYAKRGEVANSLAHDDPNKAARVGEADSAEISYRAAAENARIKDSNREFYSSKILRDEQELRDTQLSLTELTADISATEAQIAALQQSTSESAPDKSIVDATASELARLQNALASAETDLAAKEAALARSLELSGPGMTEVQALNNLIERSFEAARGGGKPGRVSSAACLQWFARNPQVSIQVVGESDSNSVPVLVSGKPVPAIATHCHNILLSSMRELPENSGTAETEGEVDTTEDLDAEVTGQSASERTTGEGSGET